MPRLPEWPCVTNKACLQKIARFGQKNPTLIFTREEFLQKLLEFLSRLAVETNPSQINSPFSRREVGVLALGSRLSPRRALCKQTMMRLKASHRLSLNGWGVVNPQLNKL
jgi:hypothetical protein